MNEHEQTCDFADRRDPEARYLGGRLTADEAEAFEAHWFACDACWGRLRRALELRAAFAGDGGAQAPEAEAAATRSTRNWWPMAAGLAVATLLLGMWQIIPDTSAPDSDAMRGPGDSLQVSAHAEPGKLAASWPPVPEADVYRVRLFTASGTLLLESETRGNELEVLAASLPELEPGRTVYWSVEALDELRISIARSELIEAVPFANP